MDEDPIDKFFKRLMKDMFKYIEDIERAFRVPGFGEYFHIPEDITKKVGKKPEKIRHTGGFSISISSNGIGPPKMTVHRFGPRGWEKIPHERLKVPVEGVPVRHVEQPVKILVKPEKIKELPVKEKIVTSYNVSINIKEVVINMAAEGVESKEDVNIEWYPESIEVYAVSRKLNKGYFASISVPASLDRAGTSITVKKDAVIIKIPRLIMHQNI